MPGAPPEPPETRRVEVSPGFVVELVAGQITVEARPLEGETPLDFARRLVRSEPDVEKLVLPAPGGSRNRVAKVPYAALTDEARKAALAALFPADVRATKGWIHTAITTEPVVAVANWFTRGRPEDAAAIAKVNGLTTGFLTKGMSIWVPAELLVPPVRGAEPVPDTSPLVLEFGEDEKGRYGLYRLRKGEALYSAVVVRFTGRLFAEDVILAALRIAQRSGIDDVHGITVGFPVKIPIEEITPEFLPRDDPKAEAYAKEKAQAAQFGAPAKARGLEGVRVVIDAGHGGRDTGTLHDNVWESTYVYDVACRLRALLQERTQGGKKLRVAQRVRRHRCADQRKKIQRNEQGAEGEINLAHTAMEIVYRFFVVRSIKPPSRHPLENRFVG